MKVKTIKVGKDLEGHLQTIKTKYGVISDSDAFRLAVALTAGGKD